MDNGERMRGATLRVLILDFDGVIVESNDVKTEAFRQLFSRFPEHADAMMAYHHANVSVTRFVKFDQLLKLLNRAGDSLLRAELAEEFSLRVFDRMRDVPLVPGAELLLGTVYGRVPMYLASVTPADELERILRQRNLLHWFTDVYGCPPWTKPKAILDVLAREQVGHSEALLIGDSAGDQSAAQETGVDFLARDSGLMFDQPLPRRFPNLTPLSNHIAELLP